MRHSFHSCFFLSLLFLPALSPLLGIVYGVSFLLTLPSPSCIFYTHILFFPHIRSLIGNRMVHKMNVYRNLIKNPYTHTLTFMSRTATVAAMATVKANEFQTTRPIKSNTLYTTKLCVTCVCNAFISVHLHVNENEHMVCVVVVVIIIIIVVIVDFKNIHTLEAHKNTSEASNSSSVWEEKKESWESKAQCHCIASANILTSWKRRERERDVVAFSSQFRSTYYYYFVERHECETLLFLTTFKQINQVRHILHIFALICNGQKYTHIHIR